MRHDCLIIRVSKMPRCTVPDNRNQLQRELFQLLQAQGDATQRDLFRSLASALELIVRKSSATHGYIEVRRANGEIVYTSHSLTHDQIASVQAGISSGIIHEALSSGKPVLTRSAIFDPRFNTRQSVRNARLEAVFCAPLAANKTRGVLYLQGGFDVEDDQLPLDVEYFSGQIAPLLDQLLLDDEAVESDHPLYRLRERYQLSEVIGSSDAIYNVLRSAVMVAPLSVGVLLTGNSGTGKSQLARVIHANSGRDDMPFVEINCAALPDTLIENELFGAVKGAHSEASTDVPGKVGVADGGTLFLDEIGAMPLSLQAKLLQFLHAGEYYPLGSTRLRQSSARLIFATNGDLKAQVEEGSFREDLFYRINTFPIHMPELSERSEDIGELADHMCLLACAKHQFQPITISRQGKALLTAHDWPGNVRELAHHVESACIRAAFDGRTVLGPEYLTLSEDSESREEGPAYIYQSFQEATAAFQASFLSETLARFNGNVSQAARHLKISRTHLHHLINVLDVSRPE